jgi:hypothetical protein
MEARTKARRGGLGAWKLGLWTLLAACQSDLPAGPGAGQESAAPPAAEPARAADAPGLAGTGAGAASGAADATVLLRERARAFLVEHMPEGDRGALPPEFLDLHVDLALAARAEFPWAANVPEAIFLNDVLPYGVLDEPRDPWRAELLELCRPIVAGARTASEAAQAINREFFQQIGLHYNTSRERANQSYVESRRSGKASCTGLSIALVNACRAVGIPARAVGTPNWTKKQGNHTWVEVWDGDWHFCGADEYDAAGLDRGWFVGDAADALVGDPRHGIFASSWKREGAHFPLAWAPKDTTVAAVEVTARYARSTPKSAEAVSPQVFLRVFDSRGGARLAASVELVDSAGRSVSSVTTRAGTSDLNDMPSFSLERDRGYTLLVRQGGETRVVRLEPRADGRETVELFWSELEPGTVDDRAAEPLGARNAFTAMALERLKALGAERAAELEARSITLGDKTLRWLEKPFGEAPEGERSLWISMHGGGGAPSEVNDQQWQNQVKLYDAPPGVGGLYVAPRAPTDTWNLWHEAHIDALFSRLIEDYVALRGVDPDRVYLLGYSAGGDGVWQLAPRMADRFAAAAMMAGHPNEASLLGLRNLPFAILMGGDDKAYDRNKIARERAEQLDALRSADPEGYEHFVRIYDGLGHWMQKQDAEALPWLNGHRRNAWPRKVVWHQDDVVHERFYWLGREPGVACAGETIVAEVDGRTIRVTSNGAKGIVLWLSDELLSLDEEVIVELDGVRVHAGPIPRDEKVMQQSLDQRFDPKLAATARLALDR